MLPSSVPPCPLGRSHDGIAGQVGDPAEVVTVTRHQDVALVAPALAPTVNNKKRERERDEG